MMPPHLRPFIQAIQPSAIPPLSLLSISPFLLPFLHTQHRYASILTSLSDNPGAYHKKIRLGRGPASGKGKTSGRGHKGQKQHGKVPQGFNGGQTTLEKLKGSRGFKNVYAYIPIQQFQWFQFLPPLTFPSPPDSPRI